VATWWGCEGRGAFFLPFFLAKEGSDQVRHWNSAKIRNLSPEIKIPGVKIKLPEQVKQKVSAVTKEKVSEETSKVGNGRTEDGPRKKVYKGTIEKGVERTGEFRKVSEVTKRKVSEITNKEREEV
jgi:hypothetical protein